MPRRIAGTGTEVFQVIITRHYGTEILGPYSTLAAAKGIVTAATNPQYWRKSTGIIERATVAWEKVSD